MVQVQESLQSAVEELALRLKRLEDRVAALEARPAEALPAAGPVEDEVPLAPSLPRGGLALAGRTLLVLAGAYLVRALTDGRVLAASAGVALGLAYAAFWQLRADREARLGRRESAAFHDLASSLIAFPLIWETAARLGLLGSRAAFAALVVFFGLGLGVAVHRRLVVNAVLTTALALVTALALLVSTHDLLAALLALLAVAAFLEWLAFRDAWLGLRWGAAAVLDGVAFLMIAVVTRPQLPPGYVPLSRGAAALALLALPALYIVSVAARTLRHGRPVTAFEAAQGTIAVFLGFGGAWKVLGLEGGSHAPGVLAVLLGGLCYAAAFAFAERREGQGRNFYFYSTAGAVLTLGGTSVLGLGSALPLDWAGLGLAAAVLGRHFDRMTLRVHSALYLSVSALHTGLLVACARAVAGEASGTLSAPAWTVAAAVAAGWAVLAADPGAPRAGPARAPQVLLALLGVFAMGKAAQLGVGMALRDVVAEDAGAAAVIRTAVLAGLVLALAWASRRTRFPELGWLVYPLIVLGGAKLVFQDLRHGRPATLVVSLALYGAVLVLAPRLMRGRE